VHDDDGSGMVSKCGDGGGPEQPQARVHRLRDGRSEVTEKPATGGGPLAFFPEFVDARDSRSGAAMRLATCPNVLRLGLEFSLSNFNLILL
jgi:hypothetical protein